MHCWGRRAILDLGLLHHIDVDLVEHIGEVFGLAKAQAGDVYVLWREWNEIMSVWVIILLGIECNPHQHC